VHNLRIRRRERIATGTVRIQLACNSMCWLEGYSPLTTEKRGEKKKKDKRGRRRRTKEEEEEGQIHKRNTHIHTHTHSVVHLSSPLKSFDLDRGIFLFPLDVTLGYQNIQPEKQIIHSLVLFLLYFFLTFLVYSVLLLSFSMLLLCRVQDKTNLRHLACPTDFLSWEGDEMRGRGEGTSISA